MSIVFRQFFHDESASLSYLLADALTGHAVLIDPVCEQAGIYLSALQELELDLVLLLATHFHAGDSSGTQALQEHTAARTAGAEATGAYTVDHVVGHGDTLVFGNEVIRVIATPGHTTNSVTYKWRDRIFTGDALLIGGCGRTDFPGGNPADLYDSLTQRLLSLPDETLVFPGHDYRGLRVSSIAQEKLTNTKLGGRSRNEFVDLMTSLPHPTPASPDSATTPTGRCARTGTLIDIHAA